MIEQQPNILQALKGAPSDDTCAECGGQLAIIRGKVMIPKPGTWGGTQVVEENSPRARRQSYVGCGSCDKPVAQDHPRQVKLDREWEELEKNEAAERQRAAKNPPPPATPINPVMTLVETVEFLTHNLGLLKAAVEALTKRVATVEALTKRIDALEQGIAELTRRRAKA